ncbi:MAG: right-handed parallel beta-helix repeat-containing protein [Euryarchaeota archaeon]|nr:right-handed parallel beta-helix repeat-containing protein [Euryarchaeota archaeon]
MGNATGKVIAITVGIMTILSAVAMGGQQRKKDEGLPAPISPNYIAHAPIRINSDAEFASMAASEGWAGAGSSGNPYIIENYEINGGSTDCIYVENTICFFIVRNCYLHSSSYNGLELFNVKHAHMETTTATDNHGHGCYLESSDSNTITNNTISLNNRNGIHFFSSCNNRVSNNTVSSNNDSGVFILSYSSGNELDNNSIQSNKESGILLASNWWNKESTPVGNLTNCNIITHNTISSNFYDGITLYESGSNTIANNTISSTGGPAIQLIGSEYNHIQSNIISGESEYTYQIVSADGHYGHYYSAFVPYSTCGFIGPEAIYVPATDCTFMVFFNWSFETYITEYNHTTDTFSGPVLIGVNPNCYNDHCMPALSIDNDGYIYVFYGQRTGSGGQLYKKSVNPYDITQWSAVNYLGVSNAYAYPQVWNYPDGDKIIYIAHDYNTGHVFMTDSNNWTTWNATSRIDLTTTGATYLISAMDSENNHNIHLAWSNYLQNGNVYYMNSSDGGRTWYAADGTYLGNPSTDGPIYESQALAFTVSDCLCQVISGNINFDSSGNPLITFCADSANADNLTRQYKLARWDGSDWVISSISYGQGQVCILPDNDTAYRAYCIDFVNLIDLGSGPLKEYISTDSGASWTYNRTIAGGAAASPVRVYNAKSDRSLEFTFCGGSFTGNFNAWGQDMSQGRYISTRPIGILLDTCDLRYNPDGNNNYYAHIQTSNYNTIANNTISNTSKGIALCHACIDNTIINNTVTNNDCGIVFSSYPTNNAIYHNRFINNTHQAINVGANQWDNDYPSGGNYWSDYGGIDVKSGPLQDLPGSDGIGDTPLIIDADARDDYPLMSPYSGGPQTLAWVNVTVHLGWNLISVPLVGPSRLPDALMDKSPQGTKVMWDRVMWWDATDPANHWKQYYSAWNSTLNDLLDVNMTMGFWLNVSSLGDGKLCLGGYEYANQSTTLIPLYAGWNMIGYPGSYGTYTVGQFRADTGATRVETYSPNANYLTKVLGTNYLMKPGEGYWVYVPADTVWIVDW